MSKYCIRGNNRETKKKEIIKDGFRTKKEAAAYLAGMAPIYFRKYTYARVAKSDAYIHPSQRS